MSDEFLLFEAFLLPEAECKLKYKAQGRIHSLLILLQQQMYTMKVFVLPVLFLIMFFHLN